VNVRRRPVVAALQLDPADHRAHAELFRPNALKWDGPRAGSAAPIAADREYLEAREDVAVTHGHPRSSTLLLEPYSRSTTAASKVAINDTLFQSEQGSVRGRKDWREDLLQSELRPAPGRTSLDGAKLDFARANAALSAC
jgi:hypothetical protein